MLKGVGCLIMALSLGACAAGGPLAPGVHVTPIVDTKPAVTIPLGSQRDDVVALLGHPTRGPRVDNYSELIQYTYIYPFPAVTAETKLSRTQTRNEVGDRIHLFFDRGGTLRKMGLRTDPYYPSIIPIPVERFTVAARAIDVEGRQIPLVTGVVPPAPPPSPDSLDTQLKNLLGTSDGGS